MAKFQLSARTEDILSMGVRQLSRLPLAEQKKVLKQVVQTANRRIKSLGRLEFEPTALRNLRKSGITRFSTGGTEKQLHRQYAILQDFFYQKSSTVEGALQVQQNIFAQQAAHVQLYVTDIEDLSPEQMETLNKKYEGVLNAKAIKEFSKENAQKFWDIYHKVEEQHLDKVFNHGSPKILQIIRDEYSSVKDWDVVERRVMDELRGVERERTQKASEDWNVFSAGRNSL